MDPLKKVENNYSIHRSPEHIAIDLLSQAEHDELAQSILITDDLEFAEKVSNNINKYLKYIKRKEIAKMDMLIILNTKEVNELKLKPN